MFPAGLLTLRWGWVFFLFVSFWPWEKDVGEIKKTSFSLPQDSQLLKVVRVAVFYEKTQVLVSTSGSFEMQGLPDNRLLDRGPTLAVTAIRPDPSGIRVGSTVYPVSGLRITSGKKEIQVDKTRYRDAIQVLKNPGGSLTVVNEIDVEEYLKGVLPREVHSGWPEEALKAQAVISRTYALFKNIENKDFSFALSSDTASQVYGGKTAEHPTTNRAVEQTRGEILTYNSRIFTAYFHAACGGRTARADYQWKVEPHAALKGVECLFCRGSRYDHWRAEYPVAEIERLLARKGHRVSGLQSIALEEADVSGRPRFFVIHHAKGKSRLTANEFRLAVGADRMKSTRIQIQLKGDKLIFEGRGWGHGVGLCQWGAKHLAELGYRYPDILRYYYPETTIQNITEIPDGVSLFPEEDGKGGAGVKGWFRRVKTYLEEL